MSKFQLYVYEHNNVFKCQLDMPSLERFNIPFLGITNSFLQAMDIDGVDIDNVLRTMLSNIISKSSRNEAEILLMQLNFFSQLTNKSHYENPLPFILTFHNYQDITPDLSFLIEKLCISKALTCWLKPVGKGRVYTNQRKRPIDMYTDFFSEEYSPLNLSDSEIYRLARNYLSNKNYAEHLKLLLIETYTKRLTQFSTQLVSINITKSKTSNQSGTNTNNISIDSSLYTSLHGILPLMWAEITYAYKNNIFINKCEVCSNWFPIQKGKYNQKYCSTQCRSKAKAKKINLTRSGSNGKEERQW